jgi:hypothetical protein
LLGLKDSIKNYVSATGNGIQELSSTSSTSESSSISGELLIGDDSSQLIDTSVSLESLSWDELKIIADDLSANGESSAYYDAMVAYMMADDTHTVDLGNLGVATVRVIGICHDTKTGGGTAGLTFRVVNDGSNCIPIHAINSTWHLGDGGYPTSEGGWEACEMRDYLDGTLAPLFKKAVPGIETVAKLTHNDYGVPSVDKDMTAVSVTDDVLFLPSAIECWGASICDANYENSLYDGIAYDYYFTREGSQYEYYALNNVTVDNYSLLASDYDTIASTGDTNNWTRSTSCYADSSYCTGWIRNAGGGYISTRTLSHENGVAPCFACDSVC